MYINNLPVTRSLRFIYADDICCALQAETFRDRAHSDSRSCSSCQILSAVAPKTQHVQDWQVFSTCITRGQAVNWIFTWMVKVSSTIPTQCILVSLKTGPFHTENICHVSPNSLVLHEAPAQASSAHQPWLFAAQPQNTAVEELVSRLRSSPLYSNIIMGYFWLLTLSIGGPRLTRHIFLIFEKGSQTSS